MSRCMPGIKKMAGHQNHTHSMTISPRKQQGRAPHASRYFPKTALHANPPITNEKVIVTSPIIQSPEHGTTTPCMAARYATNTKSRIKNKTVQTFKRESGSLKTLQP